MPTRATNYWQLLHFFILNNFANQFVNVLSNLMHAMGTQKFLVIVLMTFVNSLVNFTKGKQKMKHF